MPKYMLIWRTIDEDKQNAAMAAIPFEQMLEKMGKLNDELIKAKAQFLGPEQQIEAIAYGYWHFAFNNKEYYQLMYGLGMPGCETVKQIPELSSFTEILLEPLRALIARSNNTDADPYLKLHTLWSTLHGLISINMMGKEGSRDELNAMVLKDFINGFISGIRG